MIQETYRGAIIAYNEHNNQWDIQLGKARLASKDSLTKAREAVDRLFAKETETREKFKRRDAWFCAYNSPFYKVVVTSVTDDGREAWISGDGTRSKTHLSDLFLDSEENTKIVSEIKQKQLEVERLHTEIFTLKKSLLPFVLS